MVKFIKLGLFITFLVSNLSACQRSEKPQHLTFSLKYNQSIVDCNTAFEHAGKMRHLSQFQFYLHDLQVQDKSGKWHPTKFIKSENTSETAGLIGEICGRTSQWSTAYKSFIGPEDRQAIQFKIGLPFYENHANPLTLESPLNDPNMFWTWQTGHKFLRFELNGDSQPWIFHLGSTGCSSASSVRSPKKACTNPNLVSTQLINFDSKKPINFRLDKLLNQVDMTDPSCKSNPEQASCRQLLKNLGIGASMNSVITQN